METKEIVLPKVEDLFSENAMVSFANDKLNLFLNQPPHEPWIKVHPFISNYRYLPIDKIEFMLRRVFKKYRIEILREGTSFNGVYVVVRVWYLNPLTNEMDYHDGIGACQLQTKSGTSPADLVNINQGAISMAFPIAKTVAIKDACDHFGKIFGCDLNRKDAIPFNVPTQKGEVDEEIKQQLDLITDLDGLDKYVSQLVASDKSLNSNLAFRSMIEKRKKELTPKN